MTNSGRTRPACCGVTLQAFWQMLRTGVDSRGAVGTLGLGPPRGLRGALPRLPEESREVGGPPLLPRTPMWLVAPTPTQPFPAVQTFQEAEAPT